MGGGLLVGAAGRGVGARVGKAAGARGEVREREVAVAKGVWERAGEGGVAKGVSERAGEGG